MTVKSDKLFIVVTVLSLIAVYCIFDFGRFFTLSALKEKFVYLIGFYTGNRILTISLFLCIYILIAALSLPGAMVMTVAAGSVFGLILGTVIVSIASTTGATLAFLLSRYVLRDSVQNRFGRHLKAINEGLEKEGTLYLLSLRLVPIFPFFVINLLMGLTLIKTPVFIVASQAGMLPGTLVFVNAGKQLAKIESLGEILSPFLILSFVLAGTFPVLARWTISYIKTKRV